MLGKTNTVSVYCTNNDQIVQAELIKIDKEQMIVILPNFQKLILRKSPTNPRKYITKLFGMEFVCTLEEKNLTRN